MSILVCGGAGYIGSHMTDYLIGAGFRVVVADNLVKGHRQAVSKDALFYEGDLLDRAFLDKVFKENDIESVINFAAYSLVGESVKSPLMYYENNIGGAVNLLNAMTTHGVKNIVFSSSAAVYGEPERVPITEDDRTAPKSPYGETKLAIEKLLHWASAAHGINYAALRYFNAAGANPKGTIGEDHSPETHLIPNVLRAALGMSELSLYGDDYDTEDGTCVRDYVHVMDLAEAHILTLEHIKTHNVNKIYNIGSGSGYSNKQIIDAARRVTGKEIKYTVTPRRPGDPNVLIASADKIKRELNYAPKYENLDAIIETAWNFHKNHPNGFGTD